MQDFDQIDARFAFREQLQRRRPIIHRRHPISLTLQIEPDPHRQMAFVLHHQNMFR